MVIAKRTMNELVKQTMNYDVLQAAIQRAVVERIVSQIEAEIGNSTALKALIRGAMTNFVNSKDFEGILVSAMQQKIANLERT